MRRPGLVRTPADRRAGPLPSRRPNRLRAPKLPPGAAIVELRTLCLGEMDPTSLAKLTPEELTQEVERTLAEIATQRRIQLNGREQRALARELVNDMLGLGPLEPLLEDDTITDIMVNGPEKVFVERRGKLDSVQRALPRCRTRGPCLPANRSARRAPHRREHADGGRTAEGRLPRQHRVSAAGARRTVHIDPQVFPPQDRLRQADRIRLDDPAGCASCWR